MSFLDFLKNTAKGGAIPAGFGIFDRDDPAKKANKYLSQIPGIGEKYYNPFIEGGQKAGSILESQYGKMLEPTSFIDELMKNYNTSKAAEYERGELGRGIGATAAAGGYAGTPEHQKIYADMADKIMSRDMQQYLQNALNVLGTGITGEQDFFNKGYGASSALVDLLGGNLGSQATLGFQSATQKNASRDALLNALVKALSQGAGSMA